MSTNKSSSKKSTKAVAGAKSRAASTKGVKSAKSVAAKSASARAKSAKSAKGKACAAPNRLVGFLTVIILGVAAVVLITALIMFSTIGLNSKTSKTDAQRFAAEYSNVGEDNVFVYKTGEEVANIIEHGTGAVYLGFSSCPWCQQYAEFLNEAAKEVGLTQISYFDIEKDRADNTELYQKLVSLLGPNLQYDQDGERRIFVPDAVFVVDGRVVGNDLESSKDTAGESDPSAYWTEDRVAALKSRLKTYMEQITAASNCADTCNN